MQKVEKGNTIERNKKELQAKKEELEHRKQLLEQEEKAKGEGLLESQIKLIIEELNQEKLIIEKNKQSLEGCIAESKKLEATIQTTKGGSIKQVLQNNIVLIKDEINKLKTETERLAKEIQKRIIQIEKFGGDNESYVKNLLVAKAQMEELWAKQEELKEEKNGLEVRMGMAKKELSEYESKLIASDIIQKELAEDKGRVSKSIEEKTTEMNSLTSQLKTQSSETEERIKLVKVLRSENAFIESEETRFGVEGSEYDFDAMDIKELSDQSGKLKREMEKLKKMININIDEIGDAIEKQYNSLIEKKKIVQKDKERLLKTIDELDTKKKSTLNEVYNKVDTDFGNIFHTLFPAAYSKLVLVDKEDITEGIAFQVSFKDIIKKSLSELSGGQKTLLALSYIFALLKYKPAPLYILDEIDDALDLSHTQNIGVMISEQFPLSQFLVISLKEGMFNNANVLYKVSLVNGGSKVDRIGIRDKYKDNDDKEKDTKRKR